MQDPTVLGMIYEEVMTLRKDVTAIKLRDAKIIGGGLVLSFICTIVFQLILAVIQRG